MQLKDYGCSISIYRPWKKHDVKISNLVDEIKFFIHDSNSNHKIKGYIVPPTISFQFVKNKIGISAFLLETKFNLKSYEIFSIFHTKLIPYKSEPKRIMLNREFEVDQFEELNRIILYLFYQDLLFYNDYKSFDPSILLDSA